MMSGVVEEFFTTTIPKEVWHYTTLAAFEGILSSGTIWATEVHFTTDKSEFVHARAVAEHFLNKLTPEDDASVMAKNTALGIVKHAFTEGFLSTGISEIFAASFSSARDLKSQWSEYSDNYRGVSIGLNLERVRPNTLLKSLVTLAPCIYATDQKEQLLEAALNHMVEAVTKLHRMSGCKHCIQDRLNFWKLVDDIYDLAWNRTAFDESIKEGFRIELEKASLDSSADLLRLASHCKHHSFYQEAEWRLALPHFKNKPLAHNHVRYRKRGTQENIPYLAQALSGNFADTASQRLPITQVIAGPCCDLALVTEILEKYKYKAPVAKSEVPISC